MDNNSAQKYKKQSKLSLESSKIEELEIYEAWIKEKKRADEFSFSLVGCNKCNYYYEGKGGFCEICANFI